MLAKSFLAWIEQADARERAEAVTMLAQAYREGALGEETPEEAEAALTIILDDPARSVRRALACAFAEDPFAPRHIVRALAADHPEVAAPVLAHSPVLQDADLIDLAATAEPLALVAIALRATISARTAHALIERCEPEVSLALAGNPGADIADSDLLAMAIAFGCDERLRAALLSRERLPATARFELMLAVRDRFDRAEGNGAATSDPKRRRAMDETLQQCTIEIALRAGDDLADFVRHLRQSARLTPALLLRSVLGGDLQLLREALAELSGMPSGRVASLMRSRADATLAALLRRAGLPGFLENPLIASIRAAQELAPDERGASFSLPVIRAAQSACLDLEGGEDVRLLALLRRYEAQAARAQSLKLAEALRQQAQSDTATLELEAADIVDLAELGRSEGSASPPLIAPPQGAVATIGAQPEAEQLPDLRSVIAEWKREREARFSAAGERPTLSPSNGDERFEHWELRRRLA